MLKYHLQTVDVASSSSEIMFSNISQEYDDLVVVLSVLSTRATAEDELGLFLNNSTSGYTTTWIDANGSTGTSRGSIGSYGYSYLGILGTQQGSGAAFNSVNLLISNYSKPVYKAVSVENAHEKNATSGVYGGFSAHHWLNTSAVTSISFRSMNSGSIAQYSSASLYGIKRGADGVTLPVASGGTVTTSGGYTIHTFTSSSTFVANRDLEVEYLVVAGGGGGVGDAAASGGGGAGGLLTNVGESSPVYISPGSYKVIVGAGGPVSSSATSGDASKGSNSSFYSFIAYGGGFGGIGRNSTNDYSAGGNGGSGGGGGITNVTGTNLGGSGITGQGNAGGTGNSVNNNSSRHSGGGGGAGGVGGNGTSSKAGDGGNGLPIDITGSTVYYAGGGGGGGAVTGGSGGLGGGGNGSGGNNISGSSGTANTGGGGGQGFSYTTTATPYFTAGGSGIVIIRYLTPA